MAQPPVFDRAVGGPVSRTTFETGLGRMIFRENIRLALGVSSFIGGYLSLSCLM
jgi:hypothetical protein